MLSVVSPNLKRSRFAVSIGKQVAVALMLLVTLLAVPNWLKWNEQSKAFESHRYLECVQSAQERYHQAHRQYATNVCDLDMVRPEPTFFAVGEITPGCTGHLADSWTLTLTRFGDAFLFGSYTMTFNQNGFDASNGTVVSSSRAIR